jgi:hypothetical protein
VGFKLRSVENRPRTFTFLQIFVTYREKVIQTVDVDAWPTEGQNVTLCVTTVIDQKNMGLGAQIFVTNYTFRVLHEGEMVQNVYQNSHTASRGCRPTLSTAGKSAKKLKSA